MPVKAFSEQWKKACAYPYINFALLRLQENDRIPSDGEGAAPPSIINTSYKKWLFKTPGAALKHLASIERENIAHLSEKKELVKPHLHWLLLTLQLEDESILKLVEDESLPSLESRYVSKDAQDAMDHQESIKTAGNVRFLWIEADDDELPTPDDKRLYNRLELKVDAIQKVEYGYTTQSEQRLVEGYLFIPPREQEKPVLPAAPPASATEGLARPASPLANVTAVEAGTTAEWGAPRRPPAVPRLPLRSGGLLRRGVVSSNFFPLHPSDPKAARDDDTITLVSHSAAGLGRSQGKASTYYYQGEAAQGTRLALAGVPAASAKSKMCSIM